LQVLPAADVSDALDCQAMILLQGLDPGEYYLEFTASRRPSESVQRALPFRIQ
jgi:hypothetical protein